VASYTAASDTDVLLFLNFLLLFDSIKKTVCPFIHTQTQYWLQYSKFIVLPALEPSFKVKPKFQTFYCSQYTVWIYLKYTYLRFRKNCIA